MTPCAHLQSPACLPLVLGHGLHAHPCTHAACPKEQCPPTSAMLQGLWDENDIRERVYLVGVECKGASQGPGGGNGAGAKGGGMQGKHADMHGTHAQFLVSRVSSVCPFHG